jgi:flagellar hook-associated protein 2
MTTQAAKNSEIRIDGFPPSTLVSEVQTVTLDTAPDNVPDGGTFTLTYRGETTTDIAWDATTGEIQTALEALTSVNSGDITVSGSIGDGVTFTFADTLGDVDLMMINSSLTDGGIDVTASISETTKGVDGYISRSSNTVDDVIDGITLHLHDTTDSSGEEITLTRDTEIIEEFLATMVESYNAAITYIQKLTAYDEETDTAGILMGDYTVRTIKSDIRSPFISLTSGFLEDIDSFLSPGQIGLELNSNGLLSLDSNTFNEAISEDYMGVLALIGARKSGSSDSNTIDFYSASETYTTAGTYDVQVEISGGAITSAQIKLSSEDTWHDATFSGNIVYGDSTFDDYGNANYAENGLTLSVDLSQDGTFEASVRVKQGFAGALEDALDNILKSVTGYLQIDQEYVDEKIESIKDKIDDEEERLEDKEEQLVTKYANLEKTLTLLQSQLNALS